MSNEIKEVIPEPNPAEQHRSLLAAKAAEKYGTYGGKFAMKLLRKNPGISEEDFWTAFEEQYDVPLTDGKQFIFKRGRLID